MQNEQQNIHRQNISGLHHEDGYVFFTELLLFLNNNQQKRLCITGRLIKYVVCCLLYSSNK